MTETANLVISVDSRDADKAGKDLNQLGNKAQRTESQTGRLTRSTDQLGRAMRGLQAAAGAAVTALAVREVIRAADTYTELQSRIKLVTDSAREQQEVYQDLLEASNENRTSVESTINLYSRLEQALEGTGVAQQEVMQVTDAFTKALKISGAGTAEAQAATQQFSQAIAGSTVRAEEFNSLIDASPRLIRAMIDELEGVDNVGALRQVLEDGELTRDRVIQALTNQLPNLTREFSNLDRKASGAMTQLKNDFIDTFGETDISGFVSSIDELRAIITDPAFAENMTALASAFATVTGKVAEFTSGVVGLARFAGEELAAQINGIAGDDIPRLRDRLSELRSDLDGIESMPAKWGATERAEELRAEIERIENQLRRAEQARANAGRDSGGNQGNDDEGGGTIQAPTIDAESHDRLNDQLGALSDVEKLKKELQTQEEVIAESYRRRREKIMELSRTTDIDKQELNELQLRNIQSYQERMTELEEQGADARNRVAQQEMDAKISGIQQGLGQASSLMRSSEKEMFQVGKAAAISNAIISTHQGAAKALELGPIVGPPLAAAISAAGFMRVRQIESQSFQGGGGGSAGASAGGGTGTGQPAVPQAPAPPGLGQGEGGDGGISITFNGNLNGLDEQDLADRIKKSIGEDIENRDHVLFSSRSRQAREINR